MRPHYKVSQAGVDLIEAFEGFRAKAARLDESRWTIGYGHIRSAREGAEVSREDALMLLRWVDLPPVEEAINTLVAVPLTQNQYDALVAFVFNIGVDAFQESEVLERLNEQRLTEAACALELWRKADIAGDPVVLDALIRRRAAEKALFLASGEGAAPTPSPLVRPRRDARAAQSIPAYRPAEIEAPLNGERAEVRLVVPYEVEPEPEAPTALAPEPAEPESVEPAPAVEPMLELAAWAAGEGEAEAEETPEVAAAPAAALIVEAAPAAWTAEAAQPVAAAPAEDAAELTALTAAWTLEAAPTAWIAETVHDAAPEPAAAASTAETSEAPAQDLSEAAPGAWTAAAVEPAEPGPAPTAWSIELPHAASVALQPPTPAAWTAAPAESDWDEPAPSSWIIGVTRPSVQESAASVVGLPAAEPAAELAMDAAPEVEAHIEALAEALVEVPVAAPVEGPTEAAPAVASEPEEIVHDVPAVSSVLQTRSIPEAAPRPRPLYSSYGPMAFAVAPPAPAAAETPTPSAADGEGAATAAQPSQPQPEAQPAPPPPFPAPSFQRLPDFQPLPKLTVPPPAFEPAQAMQRFAPAAPATASAAAVAVNAAQAKPLILTSPPADWEEPRAALTNASAGAEADELETPLFDEGWDGPGALSGRIVHHEAPAEHDARAAQLGVTGPYVLLGFIGFVAFGGALFAFSRGHAANSGAGNPVVLAWILALIGAACVGISVYFLLKRLSGQED